MARLSLDDLAAIAGAPAGSNLAALARQLGRPYITVAVAAWRMRRAGGWCCRIAISACPECGELLAARPGRRVHQACLTARTARRRRLRSRMPAVRAQSGERDVRRWASLSPEQRAADAAANRALNWRVQALTRAQAGRRGAPWSPEDDGYLLEQRHRTAREQALALGRTLWSIRRRRTQLRRAQEAAGRAPAPARGSSPRASGREAEAPRIRWGAGDSGDRIVLPADHDASVPQLEHPRRGERSRRLEAASRRDLPA
jgi:hypothetical protein